MSKKVLIRGPILTQSGYGEHARFIYRALSSRPDLFEVFVDPINWGKTSWMWEDTSERRQIDQVIGKTQAYMAQNGQFDMSFLVTIPGEWEKYRAAPINIGVTAGIESNKVSAQWLEAGNKFVNKIIVPSKFSKQTYADTVYNGKNNFGQQVRLSLNTPINVLINAGITTLIACGRIISSILFTYPRFRLSAASICPLGMDWSPPRITSAV